MLFSTLARLLLYPLQFFDKSDPLKKNCEIFCEYINRGTIFAITPYEFFDKSATDFLI